MFKGRHLVITNISLRSQTITTPSKSIDTNKSQLLVGTDNPTILDKCPSVWTIQSNWDVLILYNLPLVVPASNSLPEGSVVKEFIFPSKQISLSRVHRVSDPDNFLIFPSPAPTNKFLPKILRLHTPLLLIGIVALKTPPYYEEMLKIQISPACVPTYK